jgi:hypothetical protein
MGELLKVCAQNILFELKYKVHKHGIITPSILFKKLYQVKSNTMITKNGVLNKMRKLPKIHAKIRMLHLNTICTTWNSHSLITI